MNNLELIVKNCDNINEFFINHWNEILEAFEEETSQNRDDVYKDEVMDWAIDKWDEYVFSTIPF